MKPGPSEASAALLHCNTAGAWLFEKYAAGLQGHGIETTVYSVDHPRQSAIRGAYHDRVLVREVCSDRSSNSGARWFKEFQRLRHRWRRSQACRQLVLRLSQCPLSHVIAGDPPALPLAAAIQARNQARLVYLPMEFYPEHVGASERLRLRYVRLEQRFIPDCAAVVLCGDVIQESYRRQYGRAERLHCVYNAEPLRPPPERKQLRRKLGLGVDHQILLYQGGLELHRGLNTLLEALALLPRNVVFAMIGYGTAEPVLRTRAAASGVAERVHFLPPVPQAELASYTADADVGTIPLLREGSHVYACPGKLFEYVGAGLPILASDMPNLKQILETYGLGAVFGAGDARDAARMVRPLLEGGSARQQCLQNVRAAYQKSLNWEAQSEKLARLLRGASKAGLACAA